MELSEWLAIRFEEVKRLPVAGSRALHGTLSGYQTHRRLGIPPCIDCKRARAEYARKWRERNPGYYSAKKPNRAKRLTERKWKTYDRTLDLLRIDGGWLTSAGVALALGRDQETVERALRKLRREGAVESKVVELSSKDKKPVETRMEWRCS